MRSSALSRRGLAARALALAPVCAIVLGGLLAAPAGASVTGTVPGAIMRVMPDGTLTPLPSAHVIKPTITAAGIRSYDVTSPGLLSGIHACADIGNDGTYHAILCADMWAAPEDNGLIEVSPVVQAYCQVGNTSTVVQCANAEVLMEVARGTNDGLPASIAQCGHSAGPCPTGKFEKIGTPGDVSGTCGGVGTQDEVWTVLGNGSSIQLPKSDQTKKLASNLASQHALICG
jgi:hypothetical protein